MCIVSTVSSVRLVGNVSVRGVNKVETWKERKKNVEMTEFVFSDSEFKLIPHVANDQLVASCFLGFSMLLCLSELLLWF